VSKEPLLTPYMAGDSPVRQFLTSDVIQEKAWHLTGDKSFFLFKSDLG